MVLTHNDLLLLAILLLAVCIVYTIINNHFIQEELEDLQKQVTHLRDHNGILDRDVNRLVRQHRHSTDFLSHPSCH